MDTMDRNQKLFELQRKLNRLKLAIADAEGHGSCRYIGDGRAICVIAKLAKSEGVTIEEMDGWRVGGSFEGIEATFRRQHAGYEKLLGYPLVLLSMLQKEWDRTTIGDEVGHVRAKMRGMVEFWGRTELNRINSEEA
jgi:hypothetical protein